MKKSSLSRSDGEVAPKGSVGPPAQLACCTRRPSVSPATRHLPMPSGHREEFRQAASFFPNPLQSIFRVMYMTPASAKNISTDPISSE